MGDGEQMNAISTAHLYLSLLTYGNRAYNFDIHVMIIDSCQNKVSTEQYHVAYRGLICGAHRGHVFLRS